MYATKQTTPQPARRLAIGRNLRAGIIALVTFLALGVMAQAILGVWVVHYLDHFAPTGDDAAVKGLVLTRQAMRDEDRLVLMGSSELTFQDKYHAARLFGNKPTGFSVYVVGSGYRQSIHNFLALSALGPDVRDKQIVLFISPTWFTKTIGEKAYAKNFSMLQAYEFAYNAPLSPQLKQRAAKRLLYLGGPAVADPVLRSSLEALADGNAARARLSYAAGWPMGHLALMEYRFKDTYDVARLIVQQQLKQAKPTVRGDAIDWDRLMDRAAQDADAQSHNPFGMSDDYYQKYVQPRLAELKDSATDEEWLDSSEWDDLQLTLDAARELGARPLFVSLPVLGPYYDFKGHPVSDRQAYYARVRTQIEAAGFPVVDLSGYEYEPGFHLDPWHQGWKGSVTIAEKLDQFYHGTLPAPAH